MKKIVFLLAFLAGTVWLAWAVKEYVLMPKRSPHGASVTSSPQFKPDIVTHLREKIATSTPVRIGENELTAALSASVFPNGSSFHRSFIRDLHSDITPQRIRLHFQMDFENLTPEMIPVEFQPLWETIQPFLKQFNGSSIPISVDIVPRVYNGRVILTEGMMVHVADVPIPSRPFRSQVALLIQHLTQAGILPARARKIELKNGELLLIP